MIIIEPPGPREAVADLRTLAANHKLGGHWKHKLRFLKLRLKMYTSFDFTFWRLYFGW